MRWASSLSENADTDAAVSEVAAALRAELGGQAPQLLVAFVSPHHGAAFAFWFPAGCRHDA